MNGTVNWGIWGMPYVGKGLSINVHLCDEQNYKRIAVD
jgi:hypothetical protein